MDNTIRFQKIKAINLEVGNCVLNLGIVKQIFPDIKNFQLHVIFDPKKDQKHTSGWFKFDTELYLA